MVNAERAAEKRKATEKLRDELHRNLQTVDNWMRVDESSVCARLGTALLHSVKDFLASCFGLIESSKHLSQGQTSDLHVRLNEPKEFYQSEFISVEQVKTRFTSKTHLNCSYAFARSCYFHVHFTIIVFKSLKQRVINR